MQAGTPPKKRKIINRDNNLSPFINQPLTTPLSPFINPSTNNNFVHWGSIIPPPKPIFGLKFPTISPLPILRNKLPNNTTNLKNQIVLENQTLQDNNIKKLRELNEKSILTLQLLQNIAKRIKQENPGIKHKHAMSLASQHFFSTYNFYGGFLYC